MADDQLRALEHQLQLAHQSRRAAEHLLDGVRRALCDAGFMRDDDPYGHADLADVIRQTAGARAGAPGPCDHLCECGHQQMDHTTSGYCNACGEPCEENSGHYPDACLTSPPAEEPYAEASTVTPLTRAAVRTVVLFVGSLVGWIDEVHGDRVDQITDAALAKIGGPAPQQTTDPIDVPEPERARILKQARVHLREYRKALSTDDDYECGFKAGMLEASWHLTALGRVGDDEFWAAPIPSATVEDIGRLGGGA